MIQEEVGSENPLRIVKSPDWTASTVQEYVLVITIVILYIYYYYLNTVLLFLYVICWGLKITISPHCALSEQHRITVCAAKVWVT